MNMQTELALLLEARKTITLDDALKHYQVELVENMNESIYHGHCPLPTHRRGGGKSFRVKKNIYSGRMISWECLSTSCQAARHSLGTDVVAFIAAMEQCSPHKASEMILNGFLDRS